jgi:hypothetical protein
VRVLSIKTPEKTLTAAFSHNGGELFDFAKKDE